MSTRGVWGLCGAALWVGAACSSESRPPGPGTINLDAGADVPDARDGGASDGGGCGLTPSVTLDIDGVATPDGDTAWVDFSRASGASQLTAIPTCGGAVYNAALVQWTAPSAGIMRLRVERDQSDWATEAAAGSYLTARRLERCAWDSPAVDCSVATYETDPSHTRSDFEFRVAAGAQTIALAWSFNYANAGVRATPVPALRVSAMMVATSAYGRACEPNTANREALCPARSDCISVGGAPATCIARGASSGVCRGPLRDCDGALVCQAIGNNCVAAAAVGESCETRGCATGASCVVRSPTSASTCVALGTMLGGCRDSVSNACDAGLTCRVVGTLPICVHETAVGATCDAMSFCAGTSTCVQDNMGRASCTAAGAEGTRCGATTGQPQPCAAGLQCVEQTCRRTAAAGADCVADRECAAGLACVDSHCATPPSGRCATRGDACPTGQRCVDRACVTVVAAGQSCAGATCPAGYACSADMTRCEVVAPTNGCVNDQDCARGTACREHLCVVVGQCPPRDVNTSTVVCDENARCVPEAAGGYACRPVGRDNGICRPPPDAPCDAGHRCLGGVCVASADDTTNVCSDRLRCAPGSRCDSGCQPVGLNGVEGARCRRAANAGGVCNPGLHCDLATVTCVR